MARDRYSRAEVIRGMARAIWETAWKGFSSDPAPAVPPAADAAAEDLALAYQKANCVDVLREVVPYGPSDAAGYAMAKDAMDERYAGEQVAAIIPNFTVVFDGHELSWHGEVDLEWEGKQRANPSTKHAGKRDMADVPHVKTVAETRKLLSLVEPCGPGCPGWAVFNEAEGLPEIQVCDECMTSMPKPLRLSDDDVSRLPEAKKALSEAEKRGGPIDNPTRRQGIGIGARVKGNLGGGGVVSRFSDARGNRMSKESASHAVIVVESGDEVVVPLRALQRDDDAPASDWRSMFRNPQRRRNPAIFTDKGERMYQEIRAEYEAKGDRNAEQIAAKTVYARARDGVSGLLRVGMGRPPGVA